MFTHLDFDYNPYILFILILMINLLKKISLVIFNEIFSSQSHVLLKSKILFKEIEFNITQINHLLIFLFSIYLLNKLSWIFKRCPVTKSSILNNTKSLVELNLLKYLSNSSGIFYNMLKL